MKTVEAALGSFMLHLKYFIKHFRLIFSILIFQRQVLKVIKEKCFPYFF